MNTFQVVLSSDGTSTFVAFLYDDIQWGTNSVIIGFNAGDGTRSFTLPESLTTGGILNLETTSNVGIPGTYIFRVDQQDISPHLPGGMDAQHNKLCGIQAKPPPPPPPVHACQLSCLFSQAIAAKICNL